MSRFSRGSYSTLRKTVAEEQPCNTIPPDLIQSDLSSLMHSNMNIRRAVPADAQALLSIVNESLRSGGYPHQWIDLLRPNLALSPEYIKSKDIYVAEETTQLLGFYIRAANTLEELWIAPAHFGKGVGKELFLHANDRILRH